MNKLKLPFTINMNIKEFLNSYGVDISIFGSLAYRISDTNIDVDWILWAWHGNYLNLGAGAEIGIYYRPCTFLDNAFGLDQYYVLPELTLPMQLYLYECNGKSNIDNIFSWVPNEEQWWVTGFNPDYVGKVDYKKQVTIGMVDFSEHEEMFESLMKSIKAENEEIADEYIIFDDNNKTLWIMWYEE